MSLSESGKPFAKSLLNLPEGEETVIMISVMAWRR
jgi:hypothetical protein